MKYFLFLLRVSMGWLMFYAGITKLLDPSWTAAGYLKGATTFQGFYRWFASPEILPFTNFANEWGLTLLGAALIVGVVVRLSSWLAAALMLLYYFPVLDFPYLEHAYIVDEHIIYAFAFLLLGALRAGRVWGLETWCSKLPICARFPALRTALG